MLFEDDDIFMAGSSLKLMANSGQLVNLVTESKMQKLFKLFRDEECNFIARQAIGETFLVIVKNLGLRKIFLKQDFLTDLVRFSLMMLKNPSEREFEISRISTMLLI